MDSWSGFFFNMMQTVRINYTHCINRAIFLNVHKADTPKKFRQSFFLTNLLLKILSLIHVNILI